MTTCHSGVNTWNVGEIGRVICVNLKGYQRRDTVLSVYSKRFM